MTSSLNWLPLSGIFSSGDIPLDFLERQSAIANAIRSGGVAVRARLNCFGGWGAFARIEKAINQNWDVQVLENTARTWGSMYVQVEADLTGVITWVNENALPSGPDTALDRRKRLPAAHLPELRSFLLDFDHQQESTGGSRDECTAWTAAQERFNDYVITRDMVRNARTAVGCLGKPGKKPIHAAK